jgi:cytochrome b561
MRWKNTAAGYGLPSVALHWLMVLLIAAAYATIELKSVFAKGSAGREALVALHYAIGLSVFPLAWLRLIARLPGRAPEIEPPLPPWQALAARAAHWALYALMIALPAMGLLAANAKGHSVSFFGLELPALIGRNRSLGKWLEDIHEALATAGYWVIGLHAAAALFHHYVLRDNTLKLMSLHRA